LHRASYIFINMIKLKNILDEVIIHKANIYKSGDMVKLKESGETVEILSVIQGPTSMFNSYTVIHDGNTFYINPSDILSI